MSFPECYCGSNVEKEIWKGMNSSPCHLHKTVRASCCSTFLIKRLPRFARYNCYQIWQWTSERSVLSRWKTLSNVQIRNMANWLLLQYHKWKTVSIWVDKFNVILIGDNNKIWHAILNSPKCLTYTLWSAWNSYSENNSGSNLSMIPVPYLFD